MIRSGNGSMLTDREWFELCPEQLVIVPEKVKNRSMIAETDLRLLAVQTQS